MKFATESHAVSTICTEPLNGSRHTYYINLHFIFFCFSKIARCVCCMSKNEERIFEIHKLHAAGEQQTISISSVCSPNYPRPRNPEIFFLVKEVKIALRGMKNNKAPVSDRLINS